MKQPISQSKTSSKKILITPKMTVSKAKEITFLTRDYFDALKADKSLPKRALPELRIMLLANTIVTAYINHVNFGVNLKLFNACLSAEEVVAVWMFANEPTLNVKLGVHQLFVVKHPSYKN